MFEECLRYELYNNILIQFLWLLYALSTILPILANEETKEEGGIWTLPIVTE